MFCLAVDGFSSAYYNSPFLNDLKLPFHASVVQTLDSAIYQINHCLMDKHNYFSETNCVIQWIEIYAVDSFILLSNNRDQVATIYDIRTWVN